MLNDQSIEGSCECDCECEAKGVTLFYDSEERLALVVCMECLMGLESERDFGEDWKHVN